MSWMIQELTTAALCGGASLNSIARCEAPGRRRKIVSKKEIPAGFVQDEMGYIIPDITDKINAPRFLQNQNGDLVLNENIDDTTLQRDELVRRMISSAESLQEAVTEFKMHCRDESAAHLQIANDDRVTDSDCQHSCVLYSFDGTKKWEIKAEPKIQTTERIVELQALIRKAMTNLTGGLQASVGRLLSSVLNLETGRTVDLRLLERLRKNNALQGQEWEQALKILPECTEKVGTTVYHRFYLKNEDGQWVMIPLNFSAI